MAREAAYRKYQLTINNPLEHGFSHEVIKQILGEFKSFIYGCLGDEIGAQPHTHVYVVFKNAVMFSTMQQRFYGAHIEAAKGTHRENRDYIRKEGKWRDTYKAETNLPETFEELGELPDEPDRRIKQSEAIYSMIVNGSSDVEIMNAYPSAYNHLPNIQRARQAVLFEKYRRIRRTGLKVYYIWGKSGTGKTSGILDAHGDENVYRVTNYKHPFDGYAGESVILFDEFRSSLPLADMLEYLDIYPVSLPSRYADKVACYETAYIVSNYPLEKQYPEVQRDCPEDWAPFMRRINGGVYEIGASSDADAPF